MLILLLAATLAAEPSPPAEPRHAEEFSAFARRLGSAKFKERAAAHSALLQAGRSALPVLREALASESAEIRFRVRAILQSLYCQPLPDEVLALERSLKDELGAVSSSPAGPERERRFEALIARADASRREIAADEIASRLRALEIEIGALFEPGAISPEVSWAELRRKADRRDALRSLRDLPTDVRLQFAYALARSPGAAEKSRAAALLREALAADAGTLLEGASRGTFFIAALEAGALQDRALAQALAAAPGGERMISELRENASRRRLPEP